jgi:hypothetical protein
MYKTLFLVLFAMVNGIVGLAQAAGTTFYGKLGNSLIATDVLRISCFGIGGIVQAQIKDIAPASPPQLVIRLFNQPAAWGLYNAIMPTGLAIQEGSSPVIAKAASRFDGSNYWVFVSKTAIGPENYQIDFACRGTNGETFPINGQPFYFQNQ